MPKKKLNEVRWKGLSQPRGVQPEFLLGPAVVIESDTVSSIRKQLVVRDYFGIKIRKLDIVPDDHVVDHVGLLEISSRSS